MDWITTSASSARMNATITLTHGKACRSPPTFTTLRVRALIVDIQGIRNTNNFERRRL